MAFYVMRFVRIAFCLAVISSLFPAFGQQQSSSGSGSGAAAEKSATAPPSGGSQISEAELVGLPMNGRSYSQLATLQAGVTDSSSASASRGGGSGSINVVGGRASSNNFLLDGTNIMNTENQVPRSAAGVQLGSDAVLQVQVMSAFYGAEWGRGSGGVLNSITRSGTPAIHGTLFEYLRNSKLDARSFFDPGASPPPFKRNQFGFTITGPLVSDRTFFMGSFEGLRDRLTDTNVDFFPDALARQGIITDRTGTVLSTVPVSSRVMPYLNIMPLPNSTPLGGGLSQNTADQYLPTNENFFTVRVDHKLSERDSLFARYSLDDASSTAAEITYLWSVLNESRQQYVTLVESHIFSPSLLSALRLGFTHPVNFQVSQGVIDVPRSLYFVPDAPQFGQFTVPSMSPIGPNVGLPQRDPLTSFQVAGDVIWRRNPHGWRMGFDAHYYRMNSYSNFQKGASWTFNSLESFLQAGPTGTGLTVGLPGSDNSRDFRQLLVGMYLQDEYRVQSNLQLTLGVRYEFTTKIHDRLGKNVFVDDSLRDSAVQIGDLFASNPSYRNFAPRIGLRWNPFTGRGTLIQAGAGVFYDQILVYTANQRKATFPSYVMIINPNFDASGTFPNAVAAAVEPGANAPRITTMDYHDTSTPTVYRWNLTVQQPLAGGWDITAGYVGARGNHLFRRYESNQFPFPVVLPDGSLCFPPDETRVRAQDLALNPACRPVSPLRAGPMNPNFGSNDRLATDAQSFFNTFQLGAARRMAQGFSLQGSYTFSKSVDDDSSGNQSAQFQYPIDRLSERALSEFDIRHRFVVTSFWTPPLGAGHALMNSGIWNAIFGSWRIGSIANFRTGNPSNLTVSVRRPGYLFSATRPNLLPGFSNNPTSGGTAGCEGVAPGQELGTPDLHYDPCAFGRPLPGTQGNLGRNTVIGPSAFNIDMSLQKEFGLGSDRKLQFRMEMFNVLNHPNFGKNIGNTAVVFSGDSDRRGSAAGRRASVSTTPRQLQFALRFSF